MTTTRQKAIGFVGLVLSLSFLLFPLAAGAQQVITTPYWCGSYYSSQPCQGGYGQGQYPYQYQQYQNYNPYQYQNYNYNSNYNYNGNYNYNNNYSYQQTGYWTTCYQTVAPGYGYSYSYPCQEPYQNYNQYNYGYQPTYPTQQYYQY